MEFILKKEWLIDTIVRQIDEYERTGVGIDHFILTYEEHNQILNGWEHDDIEADRYHENITSIRGYPVVVDDFEEF